MSRDSLDPRREQMIAALYGELSPEEELEFQESLRSDAALRAEWEELQGTRSFLKDWAIPDPEPRFVFVDQAETPARKAPGAAGSGGFWGRLAGLLPAPAWSFAAVSLVLAGLMLAGFRVDRVPGGLAFHFGAQAGTAVPGAQHLLASGQAVPPDSNRPLTLPASQMSQANLDAYSADMMGAVMAMLQKYQDEQNAQLAYILNGFYEELRTEGKRDYDQVNARLEALGFRLLAEQTNTNDRIKSLMETGSMIPTSDSPPNQDEEQR